MTQHADAGSWVFLSLGPATVRLASLDTPYAPQRLGRCGEEVAT
ncbi:MAG: hypothetical protein U0744_06115 [Gemmataceae bacterium]